MLDVMSKPPVDNKYCNLKEKLLATYGLTGHHKAYRMLHLQGLGDQKPSELMDYMLSLLDGHKPCLLAEQIFLEQLPEDIRVLLAVDDFTDPRALALHADTLWLAKQQLASHAVHRVKIARKDSNTSQQNYCYYHTRFGQNARKCHSPCKYPGNAQAGRQQLQ